MRESRKAICPPRGPPVCPLNVSLLIFPSDFSSLLGEMQPSNHSYYMYQQPQGPPSIGAVPPLHTPTSESCQSQGKQQAGDGYGPPPVMSLHPSAMQHGGYHQHHHPHAHPPQSQASLNNAGFGEFPPGETFSPMVDFNRTESEISP